MLKDLAYHLSPYTLRQKLFSVLLSNKNAKFQLLKNPDSKYSIHKYYELKCIFVHIPKTAGISVTEKLFGNRGGGHKRLKDYQMIFSKAEFTSFFKFAFVRNPWDRVLSAYTFLSRGGMAKENRIWAEKMLYPYRDFTDFVVNGLSRPDIRMINHFKPQYEFITLPFKPSPALDFLAFFENINDDFQYISEIILGESSTKLPHHNKSATQTKCYSHCYNDQTRKIVAEVYSRDIELLGYEFDTPLSKSQLQNRDIKYKKTKTI